VNEWCSKAILCFHATTDTGKTAEPPEEEEAGSEASGGRTESEEHLAHMAEE